MSEQYQVYLSLKKELENILMNSTGVLDTFLKVFLAGGHIILEDVPGTGKTLLSKSLANMLDFSFQRIQFTPDLLPSDITGNLIYNQKNQSFVTRKGPIFTQILLADEINRGTPRTQSCLLQAMEEKEVSIDRDTYKLPSPFFVVATQNPVEREGAFYLPFSQLDRFMVSTTMGYPNFDEEMEMLENYAFENKPINSNQVTNIETILTIQSYIKKIFIEDSLKNYLLTLIRKTREHPAIEMGASPRSTIQIFNLAKANSFSENRDHCIPDDIHYAFLNALPHRIILSQEEHDLNSKAVDILNDILSDQVVPV